VTELRIGTSGYDYLDWKGPFYPGDLRREEFLPFYSEHFDTLELNFSYYRMPDPSQLQGIMKRSGEKLDFSIKAHSSMTHNIDPHGWKSAARQFADAVHVLARDNRLAAVLLQFPYSFHYVPERRQYLDRLIQEIHELPLVVEFRNTEWLNKRVFDALRERNTGFCCVDMPRLRGLPAALDIVTAPVAYIRFHGRNEQTWWGSDAAARFDYLYRDDELKPWIDRIISMAHSADKIRVYFNNHRRGQAPENALTLKKLLADEGLTPGEK